MVDHSASTCRYEEETRDEDATDCQRSRELERPREPMQVPFHPHQLHRLLRSHTRHNMPYDTTEVSNSAIELCGSHWKNALQGRLHPFLADRTATSKLIGYWHDAVVCLSVRPSACLSVAK